MNANQLHLAILTYSYAVIASTHIILVIPLVMVVLSVVNLLVVEYPPYLKETP